MKQSHMNSMHKTPSKDNSYPSQPPLPDGQAVQQFSQIKQSMKGKAVINNG